MMKAKKGNKFRASFKSKRRGIKVVGKWKPVEIDPNLFADEQLGDLVCFEELTDYKLISSSKSGKEKGKKRKSDSVSEEEDSTNQKKKRRKGKGLGTRTSKNDHSEERDDTLTDHEDEPKDTVTLTDSEENENKAETASGTEKTLKKKKKKKASAPQQAPPPAKSSKKVTNWTTQVLSGSSDQIADVSAWKDLFVPKPVLQALSSLGFSAPTPIQALALPSAIRDHMDILGAAETGSGKTLAFAIPMIHAVLEWQNSKSLPSRSASADLVCEDGQETNWENDNKMKDPSPEQGEEDSDTNESITTGCMKVLEDIDFDFDNGKHAVDSDKNRPLLGLVLAPTRELAVQVKHHIDAAAKFTGIKTAILVGGMAPQKQQRVLNRKPEIVIATPGRLWELIKEKHPHLSNLRQLRCLVIDEADRMVERGHFLELSQLLEVLSDSHYNPQRQTFVFSATLTLVHQAPTRVLQKKNAKKVDRKTKLEMLIEKVGIKGKPKIIDLTRKEATVETLTETRIHCEKEEKDYYLYYFLLQYPGRTMVFANSIDCIKRLSALLTILDCNPLPLHANMHQKQRLKNLERFAEQESCILLTTDVAARGLDIPNVQHVLHYQVPRTSEIYVHRSGRTARAANSGLSLLLIGPDDMINFRKIYKTLEKNDDLAFFPVETKYITAVKERVNLARQIEKMEYYNSRARQHNSWFQQAAEALEIDLDDDVLIGGRSSEQEESKQQKMLKGMKKHLKHLLSQPLFKILMKTKYPTQSGKLLLPWSPVSSSESALSTVSKQQAKRKKKKRLITDELEK
ncbi:PREDICTED: ATP-dependent RNA helicase DDX24 isoform X1 [Crocodylus porosus]|uniref:ATP-dependent RNA helicase n=1 Tax=Crocodylus porosus TaxID=8502 RepID=A0A7M4FWA2_CROPO|nr:PREDICTED: ATP-dependent RNA helicase DDX24 isoform X1 [Crocodylus porosus]XP_019407996.1 PREDICTED: ATP-dependent RNA helicase DDX24 isoform X1 [Crocodylus porosus]